MYLPRDDDCFVLGPQPMTWGESYGQLNKYTLAAIEIAYADYNNIRHDEDGVVYINWATIVFKHNADTNQVLRAIADITNHFAEVAIDKENSFKWHVRG